MHWETHDRDNSPCFMPTDRLVRLRRALHKYPQSEYALDRLSAQGMAEKVRDAKKDAEVVKMLAKNKNKKIYSRATEEEEEELAQVPNEPEGSHVPIVGRVSSFNNHVLPLGSPLERAVVGNSVSSKVNFILSEVRWIL